MPKKKCTQWNNIILIAGIMMALVATPAWAATTASVKDMADADRVTIRGTVENFDGQSFFMLRDTSGTIEVNLASAGPVVVSNGDMVTVTGIVDKGILGATIAARSVIVDKETGEKTGETNNFNIDHDTTSAPRLVTIQFLPASGFVKINGVVDNVANEKKFTLRDSTGHVDVYLVSNKSPSVDKNTEVTVIGYVNNGTPGKSINATEVDIRSSRPFVPLAQE